MTITVDGLPRTFVLYRPRSAPADAPLVILLHGSQSNGATFEAQVGFDRTAAADGIVVVYPDALGPSRGWHDQCCQASVDTPIDVDFLYAIIIRLRAAGIVGRQRAVVGGFSSGALMALDAGCKLAGKVGVVVAVSGTLLDVPTFVASGLPAGEQCAPTQPVTLLAINGDADTAVPIQGEGDCGRGACGPGDRHWTPPLTTVADWWARLNGCSGATEDPPAAVGTTADADVASEPGCPSNGTVTLVTVHGAGHDVTQIEAGYPLVQAIAAETPKSRRTTSGG